MSHSRERAAEPNMNINPDAARDIPCKNILIYGYCKFENKGCAFAHITPTQEPSSPTSSKTSTLKSTTSMAGSSKADSENPGSSKPANGATAEAKRKFNLNTPSFQPLVLNLSNKFATLSPKLKDLPVFVPSGLENEKDVSFTGRKFNASTPSFTPSHEGSMRFPDMATSLPHSGSPALSHLHLSGPNQHPPAPPKQQNPYLPNAGAQAPPSVNSMPSDFMFHQAPQTYSLNHHLYSPAPPPRLSVPLSQHETNVNDMFIPNDLRERITKKNEATLQTLAQLSLPEHVGVYHSLVPIDATLDTQSKVYQLPSHVYKVMSNITGLAYALRRIDYSSKLRILNELPFGTVKKWRGLKSANVVSLADAFTSVAFSTHGEPTLCLAYDYYPMANTLQEQHLTRKLGSKLEPITEDLLWSYMIQITSALLTIHEAGLHAGSSVDLSKILVTNKNRVRLGGVCADDILEFEAIDARKDEIGVRETVRALQLSDLQRFGKVILELASATVPVSLRGGPLDSMLSHLSHSSTVGYSEAFLSTLKVLNEVNEEFDLASFYTHYLALRSLKLINGLQDLTDYFEGQLTSEVENGRLFRLMAKINFLCDRPDKEDNGSMFVIKLFREFVFQSHDEFGKPVGDLSKVLVNLNKLDVGTDEKLLLISSEEDSCIIVSYKEVKDILDLTFRAVFR